MWTYRAPLRDMRFVLEHVLQAPESWAHCADWHDLDLDTVEQVLREADRHARDALLPLNAAGDRAGCRLERPVDGGPTTVHTPPGYREAYAAFVEAGWPALPCAPEWGGQGLPLVVDAAVREMLVACNHGWVMYPDLLHGAYETLAAHGSDELKARHLEDIATGRTLAAMALTEPGAGTDLGVLRTRAEAATDGSLRIHGQKIFISGADHDLTQQVVHLVLCRLGSDAPPGTKGITLALVPKWLPDGTRNAWQVDSLEHKMGIHGSATCAVRYEGATGWIVGEPHRGLAAMFLMMNSARLHVGLQGLGHQEIAVQNARRYAAERVQMGRPIEQHAAVRHLLLRAEAMVWAQRVIAYRAARAIDEAHHHADADARRSAGAMAALLTPIVKAFCTHHGFHSAVLAQQVYGGYGYTAEFGIEQTVRDARIAMVYEGTNEVQAIDLVQRKLLADGGAALAALLDECAEAAHGAPAEFAEPLAREIAAARHAAQAVLAAPAVALEVADDVLHGLAHTLVAWACCAGARALEHLAADAWSTATRERLRYGVRGLLPQAAAHWARVEATAAAAY
jgi:alkylation response protein AidB-like acyl-CoA dehydrogenase